MDSLKTKDEKRCSRTRDITSYMSLNLPFQILVTTLPMMQHTYSVLWSRKKALYCFFTDAVVSTKAYKPILCAKLVELPFKSQVGLHNSFKYSGNRNMANHRSKFVLIKTKSVTEQHRNEVQTST